MNEEPMLKPALIGGVLLGILSALPIVNCGCCAWIIGGGMLAAYLYVKDSRLPVTLGRGVALGLLTGVIGTIVVALFFIPLHLLSQGARVGFMEQMRQTIDQMPNMPPESRQMMRSLFSAGRLSYAFYAVAFIFMLVPDCILGAVGSMIGVALFEKRKPGAPSIEPPPYQPPSGMPPPPPPTIDE